MFRFQILATLAWVQLRKLRRPRGVFVALYNGRPIPEGVFTSVASFIALYLYSVMVIALALAFFNVDAITALAAAASAIGNVGPGVGEVIGPKGNFDPLPDAAKYILMFGMFLGRLELMTVFVFFMPSFWRK